MPKKCYYKPNRARKRTFTAKDVGRIACASLSDGESRTRIRNEVDKCLRNEKDTDCERLRVAVRNLLPIFAAVAVVLVNVVPVFRIIRKVLFVGSILYKALPKTTRARLESSLQQLEGSSIIEGQFTRLVDDIRIIVREFPEETLPRG